MEVARTVICRIKTTEEDFNKLYDTVEAFNDACNYVSETAFRKSCFDPVALHRLTYRIVRTIFRLPANLAVQAIENVAKSYRSKRGWLNRFDKGSINLDGRLFCLLRNKGFRASISTVCGRIKPKLAIGEYQRTLLENPVARAKLVLKNSRFYLRISVTYEVLPKGGDEPVGVDVGVRKLLAASNGFAVKGGTMKARRLRFEALRDSLRNKGTPSAKRRLKRLAGREKRWMKTLLHQASRAFVDSLEDEEYVVLERLYGVGEKARPKKNPEAVFQSWAINRLQQLINYKCEESGIPVVFVKPDFTSQRCPRCGTIDKNNRRSQALFRCISCGFQHNADFVASINLRELARGGWAVVSQPYAVYETRKLPSNSFIPRGQVNGAADYLQDALKWDLQGLQQWSALPAQNHQDVDLSSANK